MKNLIFLRRGFGEGWLSPDAGTGSRRLTYRTIFCNNLTLSYAQNADLTNGGQIEVGSKFDFLNDGGAATLAAYQIVRNGFPVTDAFARVKVDDHTTVTVRILNLTDEIYAKQAYGTMHYQGAPRSFEVTMDTCV